MAAAEAPAEAPQEPKGAVGWDNKWPELGREEGLMRLCPFSSTAPAGLQQPGI